jgi:hypothetical protein
MYMAEHEGIAFYFADTGGGGLFYDDLWVKVPDDKGNSMVVRRSFSGCWSSNADSVSKMFGMCLIHARVCDNDEDYERCFPGTTAGLTFPFACVAISKVAEGGEPSVHLLEIDRGYGLIRVVSARADVTAKPTAPKTGLASAFYGDVPALAHLIGIITKPSKSNKE